MVMLSASILKIPGKRHYMGKLYAEFGKYVYFVIGKLFYLDGDKNGSGCYCKESWKAYYHKETGGCYEQESTGPCPKGQYFAFNATSGYTECNCFKNFAFNPADGTCVEKYTRGPCPEGKVVL